MKLMASAPPVPSPQAHAQVEDRRQLYIVGPGSLKHHTLRATAEN